MAGRALDIQAGFGLAFLLDPKTKTQVPLIGALFTYAAAAIFFLTSGPTDLLAILGASFAAVPVGSAISPQDPGVLLGFLATASVIALGIVGLAVTALFLIDLVVAMMSRTSPQMNVLVLGFQVKSMTTLVLLPMTLAYSAAGMLRLIDMALEATPLIH
jgi:flagellar biosynthetic protein FliR